MPSLRFLISVVRPADNVCAEDADIAFPYATDTGCAIYSGQLNAAGSGLIATAFGPTMRAEWKVVVSASRTSVQCLWLRATRTGAPPNSGHKSAKIRGTDATRRRHVIGMHERGLFSYLDSHSEPRDSGGVAMLNSGPRGGTHIKCGTSLSFYGPSFPE